MLKKFLTLAFVTVSIISFGQKEELTLEKSVLGQYRDFAPKSIFGFNWIPTTTEFTYLDGYVNLMKGSATEEAKQIMTIADLSAVTGGELRWFAGFKWKDKNSFFLNSPKSFFKINLDKSGEKIASLPENAENGTLEPVLENVAYTIDNNLYVAKKGGKHVAVTKNKDKNIVSGQAFARSEFGITNGIFWSDKGNFMAFYEKDETDVHDYPLLDINAYPGELKSIKYPMAGQKSEKPRVGIYNVKKGKTVYICPKGDVDNYLTNVSFTPDEQFLLIAEVNRDQNTIWLNKYTVKGKFVKTLLEEKEDTWAEPEHPAFFPLAGSNNFVWISERDGYNQLYYYDIEGKLIQKLTSNKFMAKDIVKASVTGKEIFFTATTDNAMNTMLYKVSLSGNQKLITQNKGVHSAVVCDNGFQIFDQYSNHDLPNRAVILNTEGMEMKELLVAENPYNKIKIGSAEIGEILSADGKTTLNTRLIKPSNFDPSKKYPVMVYVYGGPHAQMVSNRFMDGASLWFYWLAEQGYLVYTVDNRGSGNRGKAFEEVIHRQLGTAEMADQLEGVKYLKSLPYVDGNRLAVNGWSFGGFMTTSLMLRKAGTFNVGVAGGPVTDWKYYEIMYGERYMDRPEQNVEGYKAARLMNYVENLEGKLLLIHGTIDDVVVMQHNLALVQEFVSKGKQVDFFPYPMHLHNVYGKDRVHLIEKMCTYIIENNK